MKRSGFSLIAFGILGIAFFWITDPRFGLLHRADSPVDAANQALPGTIVGIAGSVIVLIIGLWLLGRRTA